MFLNVLNDTTTLYYLLDACTHLFFNAPGLEMRRPAIDNIARLTGRNHWPGMGKVSEDWKDAKSKVMMCSVCNAKGKKTKARKEIKTTWICKGYPREPGLCVEKDCFDVYHTNLTSASERMKNLVVLMYLGIVDNHI